MTVQFTGCLDVKTSHIYSEEMGAKLLNVRLGPEDERLVQKLKARGISISEIVRRALRDEVRELDKASTPVDTDRMLEEMFRLYPDPPGSTKSRPDATDRRAVAEHIRKQLRARRRS
jgi:hypothetical protein